MNKSYRYKTLKDLYTRLLSENIIGYTTLTSFRHYWIYPREKQGMLECPKETKHNRDRIFSEKQIEEIVNAFRPGGPGQWRYTYDRSK